MHKKKLKSVTNYKNIDVFILLNLKILSINLI